MAGVGEASAIVALTVTAWKLSKSMYGAASKFKDSKSQIEALAKEVEIIGGVLERIRQLPVASHVRNVPAAATDILQSITQQCEDIFSQLSAFLDSIDASNKSRMRSLLAIGKIQFMFKASEVAYLQKRLESMKLHCVLVLTMELWEGKQSNNLAAQSSIQRPGDFRTVQDLVKRSTMCLTAMEVLELEIQSESEALDESGTRLSRQSIISVATSTSMNSAQSRSTLESIVSLYGGEETFDFQLTPEIHPVDEDRSSFIDISNDEDQEERSRYWVHNDSFENPRLAPMPPNKSVEIGSNQGHARPMPPIRSVEIDPNQGNPPSPYNNSEVIHLACSVYEFTPSTVKFIEGFPYLTYLAGEVFDVFAEKGELWLGRNQDELDGEVGWLWNRHFVKLAA